MVFSVYPNVKKKYMTLLIFDLQFPLLLGSSILEKFVPPVAAIFVGRTGSQLFLTDDEPNSPPLLFRMASDSEDLKFM